jgi:formylglycine-generating enzyme required for sulfatase activity
MKYVEGGEFMMGAANDDTAAYDCEKPSHIVRLDSYYMGETQVTQALWETVMGNNPSYFKGDSLPVENVSWYDCQEFIKKLNSITGKNFSLPTEAQWEFAARGGNKSRGFLYSGSNNLDEVAWYRHNSNRQTHQVATKKANELGLYDMTGNVEEWCEDYYGKNYYSNSSQDNPQGPLSGGHRILRGGSWDCYVRVCRVSYRGDNFPNYCSRLYGLRLVL